MATYKLIASNEDECFVGGFVIIDLEPEQVNILNLFFSTCNRNKPITELRIKDVIQ